MVKESIDPDEPLKAENPLIMILHKNNLPKLDKGIGTLDYVNKIAGGNENSMRADGTIEIEIQAITGATSEVGFNTLTATY